MHRSTLPLLTTLAVATACGGKDETCVAGLTACSGTSQTTNSIEPTASPAPEPTAREPGVVIHTAAFTPDGTSTILYVVDELSPDVVLDPAAAIELGGTADVSVPPPGLGLRSFFVGLGEEPTIRRYDVDDDWNVTVGGELSLMGLGAMSGASLISSLTVVSRNRAYFVDIGTLQVIIIDPEKMEVIGDFPLSGIPEEGLKNPYAWYKNVDGSRIIVAFAFERSDDTPSPLSKVAIIDTATDTVTYDEQSRCGYLCWTAHDPAGNLYFVTHTYVAILNEAGLGGDPTFSPCMVRMLAGADGFDPNYYVDLRGIAGRPVGALMSGTDGTAYTLVYSPEAAPLTPDNVDSAYGTPAWEHYSMQLGNEAASFTKVPGIDSGIPYSDGQPLTVGGSQVPIVTVVAEEFSRTTVYDASDPSDWARLAIVPNYIYGIHDLP